MTDQDWKKDVARADLAKQIINSPLTKEAIEGMRSKMYRAIESSKFSHTEAREEAYHMLRAINLFESEFKSMIDKGKKSANLLEQAAQKIKR